MRRLTAGCRTATAIAALAGCLLWPHAAPAQHADHQHEGRDARSRPARAPGPEGRQLFLQHCSGCHGASAEGKVGPKLAGTPHSAAEIRGIVRRGVAPRMPAFAEKLSAREIAAVATYVKSLGPPVAGHEHGGPEAGEGRARHESRVPGQEMSRRGSGTSWLPESSPIWAKESMLGAWMIMQHADVKPMYDAQGGPRGVSRPVASNWYMAMGERSLGDGALMLRLMMSLEPATFGNNGQPQLFQTGEGLIDRQHPHDLFMEAAVQYSRRLNDRLGAYLYLAPIGEPALGPSAFPHRVSAMEIPTAPLIHHWSDSTHIAYGVLTAGLQTGKWKVEASWFNAHEPDGRRWAVDPIRLNSVSGRVTFAPNANWVFQVSRGHLTHPEIFYPDEQQGDVDRTTASATYNRPFARGNWATTFVWGRNDEPEHTSDGFLIESSYHWAERNYLFGRIERVDKDELFLPGDPRRERSFLVNAFSLGYARDIARSRSFETAIGAMVTVYAKSRGLDAVYGDFPVGVQVFLRIRPRRLDGSAGGHGTPGREGRPRSNGPGHRH